MEILSIEDLKRLRSGNRVRPRRVPRGLADIYRQANTKSRK
jgi:hypothetical protein